MFGWAAGRPELGAAVWMVAWFFCVALWTVTSKVDVVSDPFVHSDTSSPGLWTVTSKVNVVSDSFVHSDTSIHPGLESGNEIGRINESSAQLGFIESGELPSVFIIQPHEKEHCRSLLYERFVKRLRRFETADPTQARFIFVDIDTVYQWMWPNPSPYKGNLVRKLCPQHWFDPESVQIWIRTVKFYCQSYPEHYRSQRFIFFQNPNRFDWQAGHSFTKNTSYEVRRKLPDLNITVVGFDLTDEEMKPGDLNLLHPLTKPMVPSEFDDLQLNRDSTRKFLAGFRGKPSTKMRERIYNLTAPDNHEVFLKHSSPRKNKNEYQIKEYKKLLRSFVFGLALRGDAHYSFRLVEVLTYGCVPVVIDSKAAPIYVPGAIQMDDWALTIKEEEIENLMNVLVQIPNDKIRKMKAAGDAARRCGRDIDGLVECMLNGLVANPPVHLPARRYALG